MLNYFFFLLYLIIIYDDSHQASQYEKLEEGIR